MIPSHNEMAAPEILSADRGEKRFPRAGVSGVRGKRSEHDFVLGIDTLHHAFIRFDRVDRVIIAPFLLPNNRMNKHSVTVFVFHCLHLDEFMRSVNNISRMESEYGRPTAFDKQPS